MVLIDRLIDPKGTKDSTSIDRNLGSEILSLISNDCRNITQKFHTVITELFAH